MTTQRIGVDVLTVTDCPHRGLTLARLRAALDRVGLADVVVTERVIDDPAEAIAAGMHGSPTILVDGHDPFAEGGIEPSVSCRLFRTPKGYDGAPSVGALVVALTDLGRALSDCREPVPLGASEAAARRLGVEGFVALWRGERVTVTDLCDDPMVIDARRRHLRRFVGRRSPVPHHQAVTSACRLAPGVFCETPRLCSLLRRTPNP